MKKKVQKIQKISAVVMVAAMLMAVLSGCFYAGGSTTIEVDGSGKFEMYAGYSEDFLNASQNSDIDVMDTVCDIEGLEGAEEVTFERYGTTYRGGYVSADFRDLDELNELMRDMDLGSIRFNNGGDYLGIMISMETGDSDGEAEDFSEAAEMLAMGFREELVFNFPKDVKQVSGSEEGVTLEGGKLTLDILKMGSSGTNYYEFVVEGMCDLRGGDSAVEIEGPSVDPEYRVEFIDVSPERWYYSAVMELAEAGVVNGVGGNRFNPDGILTYAEFAQIMARALHLSAGEKNGYWAYEAIESCIGAGIIPYLGEITAANYGAAITREFAIAGTYRGANSRFFLPVHNYTKGDIPDYSQIDDNLKQDVLMAYNYGVTSGVDGNHTFNPTGLLTRAEVCQIVWNVGVHTDF